MGLVAGVDEREPCAGVTAVGLDEVTDSGDLAPKVTDLTAFLREGRGPAIAAVETEPGCGARLFGPCSK